MHDPKLMDQLFLIIVLIVAVYRLIGITFGHVRDWKRNRQIDGITLIFLIGLYSICGKCIWAIAIKAAAVITGSTFS